VLGQRRLDPRDEIAAVRFVIDVLKLAAATLGIVATRRLLMARSGLQRSIVEQSVTGNPERDMLAGRRDSVASGSNSNDVLSH
jgi:hypothetical protein